MASVQVDATPVQDVISESEFEATSTEKPEVVAPPPESGEKTAAVEEEEFAPNKEKVENYSDIEDDEEKGDVDQSDGAAGLGPEFNEDDGQDEDEDQD